MGWQNYKAIIVMVGCQLLYAGVNLSGRAALLQGMSSRVFVVYRQCIAFFLIAPIAYFSRRGTKEWQLGWKSFWLIFMLVTLNQNMYYEGLYLANSTAASALGNLIPAITFIMACALGYLEKVRFRSLRSMAKIVGTVLCVTGATAMALWKGPKLVNMEFMPRKSIVAGGGSIGQDTWLIGCLFLFGNAFCWALWLILQVHVSACYPDHLSLTAWMCLMAAVQSGVFTLIVEPNLKSWILDSPFQLFCCFYVGLASAATFFAQTWSIAVRGPVFCAMFNPLSTVIVTVFAFIFMHEELYTGSTIGAVAVIIGLYVVLWGKAKEYKEKKDEILISQKQGQDDEATLSSRIIDLEEPLLSERST
ncbi:WAT1-related protein [Striga hermonthica]|uniref:WAT1-related protein n=1 Tax=Striga hermonthica TaxID=68872 RepID=A0A9N7MPK2_STRHE|nr:WAT1-related protein [Striga hermonthica]